MAKIGILEQGQRVLYNRRFSEDFKMREGGVVVGNINLGSFEAIRKEKQESDEFIFLRLI